MAEKCNSVSFSFPINDRITMDGQKEIAAIQGATAICMAMTENLSPHDNGHVQDRMTMIIEYAKKALMA